MPTGPVSFRLEDFHGSKPLVLLFAPSERSPAYENQISLLEEEEMAPRLENVLVKVFGEGTSYFDGERMDDSSVDRLRTSFHVDDDDFLIVVLAPDGTEKHRSDAPIQPSMIIERLSDASRKEPHM